MEVFEHNDATTGKGKACSAVQLETLSAGLISISRLIACRGNDLHSALLSATL